MTVDTLTTIPDEETVKQYVDIVQNTDLQTAAVALTIVVIGFVLVHLSLRTINKALERSKVPKSMHTMIRTLLRVALYLVVLLTAANYIGIPVTSFITLLGLFGLAISLALQGMLSNLAGGFIILLSRPFEVGHFIEFDGVSGVVREIRMMHTRLETLDSRIIYIPNSTISSARVINCGESPKRRVELSVSASYDSTPGEVREAILAAVHGIPQILTDPEPLVVVEKYGESAIEYSVLVWVKGSDYLTVKWGLTEALYAAYKDHDVAMTYPHLNVHMLAE